MPKYSIDSDDESDDGTGDNCELCGAESDKLAKADVAGATLDVCPDCSPHDDADKTDQSGEESDSDRTREAIQRATQHAHRQDSQWAEEGTEYDSDPLPYLIDDYSTAIVEARDEQDMSEGELADKAGIGLRDLRMIERGEATRGDIGKTDIRSIEQVLGIEIIEEV